MRYRRLFTLLMGLLLLAVMALGIVLAATNTVNPSALTNQSSLASIAQLRPTQCAGLTLSNLVMVTPGVPYSSSGNSADLILGTSGSDTVSAGRGTDCIVGGAGDDTINGNQGNDVILGGAGDDDLDGGIGTDVCYGDAGTDTFSRCESTP